MRKLTDDHPYIEILMANRHNCNGPNKLWVDKLLAASPRARRRMLTQWSNKYTGSAADVTKLNREVLVK